MARRPASKMAIFLAFLASSLMWFVGDWLASRFYGSDEWVSRFAVAFMLSLVAFVVVLMLMRIRAVRQSHGLPGLKSKKVRY